MDKTKQIDLVIVGGFIIYIALILRFRFLLGFGVGYVAVAFTDVLAS